MTASSNAKVSPGAGWEKYFVSDSAMAQKRSQSMRSCSVRVPNASSSSCVGKQRKTFSAGTLPPRSQSSTNAPIWSWCGCVKNHASILVRPVLGKKGGNLICVAARTAVDQDGFMFRQKRYSHHLTAGTVPEKTKLRQAYLPFCAAESKMGKKNPESLSHSGFMRRVDKKDTSTNMLKFSFRQRFFQQVPQFYP